jgi:hypothetical protein
MSLPELKKLPFTYEIYWCDKAKVNLEPRKVSRIDRNQIIPWLREENPMTNTEQEKWSK